MPEKLDRRLRAVLFERGHVEVINEDKRAAESSRPQDTFTALIKFGVDEVLHTIGTRLCTERSLDVAEERRIQAVQQSLNAACLSSASWSGNEHIFVVQQEALEQPRVPSCINGADQNVLQSDSVGQSAVSNATE